MIKNIETTRDTIDSLVDASAQVATGVTDRAEKAVENTAGSVVDRAHEAGSYVREKVGTTARGVQQHLSDAADAIDDRYAMAQAQLSRVTSYASSNPRTALILATSLGFLLGFMAHRQRSA